MAKETKETKKESTTDNRKQLINDALKEIEKRFGEGSVMDLSEQNIVDIDTISTGSMSIDYITGVGGLPKGRIIEVYGPESSGKTTLTLHAIAECQKAGGKCAFIDAEHALDPKYAKKLGVNVDELILSQPDDGEQAIDIAEILIKSGAIDLIVIDSVAALVPRSELEGEMGDSNIGLHARLMSKAMRKFAGILDSNNCCCIFINQLREKVGIMFGNPEVTTGGRALKFYSSMRIEVRKSEAIKNGTDIIGNKVNIKIPKNKVASPFKSCQVEIYYGEGISHVSELIELGSQLGVIEKSGAWFSYEGEKIGQGKEAVRAFLQANPDLDEKITSQIKEKLKTDGPKEE